MKYRLLKPLGGWPAGTMAEYEGEESTHSFGPSLRLLCMERGACKDEYVPHQLASDPDWFEEVKAFVPKASETFWYIGAPLVPMIAVLEGLGSDFSEDILKIGNCFRTEADAESCAVEMRKLLKQWREDHP